MRAIIFSDLHLNLWNYGSSQINGWNSRLLDQKNVLAQMTQYADDNDINNIFCLGDIFHCHQIVQAETLMVAYSGFSRLCEDRNVTILAGNHDFSNKEGTKHTLSFLRSMARVVESPTNFTLEGHTVHAMPFTEDRKKLDNFLAGVEDDSIVLMHQGISDVPVNSAGFTRNELLSLDMIPEHAKAAFIGHYHSRAAISPTVWIPGSPLQLTWADRGQKRGWLDVTFPDGEGPVQVTPINSVAPEFMEVDLGGCDRVGAVPADVADQMRDNFIRVLNWEGSASEIRNAIMGFGARSVEVIYEKDKGTPLETKTFVSLPDLFDQFVKEKKLDSTYVQVGQDIMEGKYVVPEEEER